MIFRLTQLMRISLLPVNSSAPATATRIRPSENRTSELDVICLHDTDEPSRDILIGLDHRIAG